MNFKELMMDAFPVEGWCGLEDEVSQECLDLLEQEKKVDVAVCTYNSERYLKVCLQSIFDNVPVKKLWIVDNFSTDKTLAIAKQFGAHVIQSRCSLAEARKLSFQLVETELFVNVDSDVVLSRNWFRNVMQYWKGNVGCVWGVPLDQHPLHGLYVKSMYKLRRPESYKTPHLPNMVGKKTVFMDIEYPPGILNGSVANEDWFIKFWAEKKGFQCVTAPVFVTHYSYPPQATKSRWFGASSRVTGLETLHHLAMRFLLSIPQGIYAALASKNALVAPYWIKFRFNTLYGFLNYSKYFDFKRKK